MTTAMRPFLEALVNLRGYAEQPVGQQYSCFEDFVLKHGREYVPAALSRDQRAYVLGCAKRYGRPFPMRQCFYNAQMLLLGGNDPERRLTYCEGYGWRHIPCMHGWLLLDGAHVIDTTWRLAEPLGRGRLADRVFGEWTDERAYFGVTFSREYVLSYVLDREHGGSLIDDFKGGWPLLCGNVTQEAWAA